MKWFAYISDKIEMIYPGDGLDGTLPRNIVGCDLFQNIEIPEGLDRECVMWNGTDIVEDPVKKQERIEEIWKCLRIERNNRLQISDWTQISNSNLTPDKQTEWAAYRQALRDLPANTQDPANPVWPISP